MMNPHRRPETFSDWTEYFADTLSGEGLLSGVNAVLLALSGGKDSVCLFHLFRCTLPSFGVRLLCAHVDHNLRGEQGHQDARFCEELCRGYDVPFFLFSEDVGTYACQNGLSVEEAARRLRYDCLLGCAKEQNAVLATAHTASDQTETVFLQLTRGASGKALCGIEPRRSDGVIRPLLSFTSEDVLICLNAGNASFVEDESNANERFLRNVIRHRVLPPLKEQNPALDDAIARFCAIERAQQAAFGALRAEKLSALGLWPVEECVAYAAVKTLLDDAHLNVLLYDVFSQLLSNAGCGEPLCFERFEALLGFLQSSPEVGKVLEIGTGWGILCDIDGLRAVCTNPCSDEPVILQMGDNRIENLDCTLYLEEKSEFSFSKVHKLHTSAALNCDTIQGQLVVRRRVREDVYTVNGQTRKVKDLLSNRKIPLFLRKTYPIVCDDAGIVWIPGFLADDRVRTEHSGRCLHLGLTEGALFRLFQQRRQYE